MEHLIRRSGGTSRAWILAAMVAASAVAWTPAPVDAAATGTGLERPGVAARTVHARLESSLPAEGDTLVRPLASFRLLFSDPVEPGLSALALVTASGDTVRLAARGFADSAAVLRADAPAMSEGSHILVWRTTSRDGHALDGVIRFHVAPSAARSTNDGEPVARDGEPSMAEGRNAGAAGAGEPAVTDAVPSARNGTATGSVGRTGPSRLEILLSAASIASLLAFAGLLWFLGGTVLPREPRLARITAVLGITATVLLVLDFVAWLLGVVPPGAGVGAGLSAALATRTGEVALLRIVLAAAAFLTVAGLARVRPAAVLAFAAVVLGAAAGHSATHDTLVALPANALHRGAAAVWLGGLVLLVSCPVRPTDPAAGWDYLAVARRVSAAALLAVIVVLAAGVAQSLVFLDGFDSLGTTLYGRLVVTKAAGLGVLVLFGAWNRFRRIPALARAEEDPKRLRRSVRRESILLLLVVFVAAWLAHVPPPGG